MSLRTGVPGVFRHVDRKAFAYCCIPFMFYQYEASFSLPDNDASEEVRA